jgi:RNA polymerase sigma factor (sigma-70 family)
MAQANLPSVLSQLRHVVLRRCVGGLDDAHLLARFATTRDPTAFEVLVWRHGPVVFHVCRRVLGNHHDAEDALQATFLALSRQAGSIARGHALAGWLCKVAHRIAMRIRERARKQAAGSANVDELPAREAPQVGTSALHELLDAELQRLPEKYRAVLVLCYWAGLTNREIAGQLGCPMGTVSTRLARGRALLRRRLARRGISLSAGALAASLGGQSLAALPVTLVQATVQSGVDFAAGRMSAACSMSPGVIALAEGVFKMTTIHKFKLIGMALLLMAVLGAGAAWLLPTPAADAQAKTDGGAQPAPIAVAPKLADPAAQPRKESLRYGGKSFDDWHQVLITELKPELRAEAIKALSAFGVSVNGYSKQATAAILTLMHDYDVGRVDEDDHKVVRAAESGLYKIGSSALPSILDELKQDNANGRRFALSAVSMFGLDSKSDLLTVAGLLKDPEYDIRRRTLQVLQGIDIQRYSAAALGDALIQDEGLRSEAIALLTEFGEKARPAVPQLVEAAKKFPKVRVTALQALRSAKPDAKTVLPVLADTVKDKNSQVRLESISYLRDLGPAAKDAVPFLIAAWKDARNDMEREEIALAFASIGPDAREALPLLLDALAAIKDQPQGGRMPGGPSGPGSGGRGPRMGPVDLTGAIREAIRKINP